MKTEGQFNAHLGKELTKLSPAVNYLKVADKFQIGISDFLIWYRGKTLAAECKFVTQLPKPESNLLKHSFSGAQKTFLESMCLSGNMAIGIVGIDELQTFYTFPWTDIPPDGNWKTEDFWAVTKKEDRYSFSFKEVKLFIERYL